MYIFGIFRVGLSQKIGMEMDPFGSYLTKHIICDVNSWRFLRRNADDQALNIGLRTSYWM